MSRLTVDFEKKVVTDSEILFPINETVEESEALGDFMGIMSYRVDFEMSNTLWIMRDYIDVDDKDVREFLRDNFFEYKAILGFIRRVTQ